MFHVLTHCVNHLTFVCSGVNHPSVLQTERQCTCTTSFKMKTKNYGDLLQVLALYVTHLSVLPTKRQCTTRLPCYCQPGLRSHTETPLIFLIYRIYIIYNICIQSNWHLTNITFPEQLFVEVIWKCRLHFWTVVRNKVKEQLSYQGRAECIYDICIII